jgi:hypothetical protein
MEPYDFMVTTRLRMFLPYGKCCLISDGQTVPIGTTLRISKIEPRSYDHQTLPAAKFVYRGVEQYALVHEMYSPNCRQ